MADDGMFLNFSVDENNVASTNKNIQKFKGGSWTDRLQAKRTAQRKGTPREKKSIDVNKVPVAQGRFGGRKNVDYQAKDGQNDDFPDPRPAKRRRENGHAPDLGTVPVKRNEHKHVSSGPREVISSLFTYNPKSSGVVESAPTTHEDEKPTAPSNAPLIDGIDTFTSLGLSPTIAAHLLTKMNLKSPTAIQKAAISQMLQDDSDAFIQSETGSGKTLAYLLPLLQRIMVMSDKIKKETQDSTEDLLKMHRDSGLFAIVLAPTRELCKQISVVLERLLGCVRYIVAGHVLGGEKKKSEKARLRKGLNILVATPGRLVDHLENTKVLDVSNVRWLVLDEGDRLMELGFEEDISKIVKTLDQRKRPRGSSQWPGLPVNRTTVLCSATLKMGVQKLGEISLKNANLIKGDVTDVEGADGAATNGEGVADSAFLAPAQLKQSYIVCAAKLRFVTLTALLKRTFARKGSVMKAIVFVSCADSVEFNFKALTTSFEEAEDPNSENKKPSDTEDSTVSDTEVMEANTTSATSKSTTNPTLADAIATSPTLSSKSNPLTVHKLHGSLPQPTRTAIINTFTTSTTPSLLIATDVASRGLDLPNLDLVIEYDPAFSAEDHLHRIGRTARLGRDGRAVVFLLPGKEENYIDILKSSFRPTDVDGATSTITRMTAEDVLRKGFTPSSGVLPTSKSQSATTTKSRNHPHPTTDPSSQKWDTLATNHQLALERWILSSAATLSLARKAFQSHIRAYATHTASERKYFDIRELHLGHLCKSFGLRETPTGIGAGRGASKGRRVVNGAGGKRKRRDDGAGAGKEDGGDVDESARKMREKVRANRRVMMGGGGADEFNIA